MAKHTMNKRYMALPCAAAIAAALTLAACRQAPAEPAPLAGAHIGGPFALIDQDGKPFSSAQLAGRYRIVYFGYTFCPDACPTDMQVLGKAMRLFGFSITYLVLLFAAMAADQLIRSGF